MIWILAIIALIAVDVVSKRLVLAFLEPHITHSILGELLHITYVENRGAAFGMFQNQQWLFIIVSAAVTVAMICYWVKSKPTSKWLKTSLMLVIAGACGNLIDRIVYGFVVDFIYVKIIDFPVFNIADIFVVTGVIMLCIYIVLSDLGKNKTSVADDIKRFEEYNANGGDDNLEK